MTNLATLLALLNSEKQAFIQMTAKIMPDNPSDSGWSAEDIKAVQYRPDIKNYENVVKIATLIVDTETQLTTLVNQVSSLQGTSDNHTDRLISLESKVSSIETNIGLINASINSYMTDNDAAVDVIRNGLASEVTRAKNIETTLQADINTRATKVDCNSKTTMAEVKEYLVSAGIQDQTQPYTSLSDFPAVGDDNVFYIAKDTNLLYRWTGSAYTVFSSPLTLG